MRWICGCHNQIEEDGSVSLVPDLPFSEMPNGEKTLHADETGNLAWYLVEEGDSPFLVSEKVSGNWLTRISNYFFS